MIAVDELDRIARARLHDAKSLLAAGRFDGATYVCGYAVAVWKADSSTIQSVPHGKPPPNR